MVKITKTIEAEIPPRTLTYDLSTQDATCRICRGTENRGSQGDSRSPGYDLESFFSRFAQAHFECILRAKDHGATRGRERAEPAPEPERKPGEPLPPGVAPDDSPSDLS